MRLTGFFAVLIALVNVTTPLSVWAKNPSQSCSTNSAAADDYVGALAACESSAPKAPGSKKKSPDSNGVYVGEWSELAPGCGVPGVQSADVQVQAGATGAGTGCVVEECEPGQQNFTRTRFERTAVDAPVAVTGFENAGCQGPAGGGVSVDELAVREFFSTKITVDPPKMQPDTGVLLVNMPNNFFCTTPKQFEMDSSITINGGVRFRLTVDELVFDYGVDNRDSSGSRHDRFDRTDRLGKAIEPEVLDRIDTREELRKASEVWHEYWQTGTFDVLVTVYFTGEYSVGGGAWQPITGSIYATSASRQVRVFQTRAELVDPNNQ